MFIRIIFTFVILAATCGLSFSEEKKYVEIFWLKDVIPSIELKKDFVQISLPIKLKQSIEQNFPEYRMPSNKDYDFDWAEYYNFPVDTSPKAKDAETLERIKSQKAPFIAIGDFNQDKIEDIAVLLVGKKRNNFWKLVVFHGSKTNYGPVILLSSPQGGKDLSEGGKRDLGPVQRYGILKKPKCNNGFPCLNAYVFESSNFEYIWENSRYRRVDVAD